MINKKTSQRVCCFNWKNRDWGSSFSLFCILISMKILCPLIDIDARIKIIYINSSHIKLLRWALIAINISNLFLAFKYVKHYHLIQKLKGILQSNLNL